MSTASTKDEILDLFHAGNQENMAKFIRSCPDFPLKSQAADLVKSGMPGAQTLALGTVSQGLAFGRATNVGAEVAMAAHTLAREDFDKYGPAVILPVTKSRLAYEAMHALNVAGRYEDTIAFADEVMPLYADEPENGPSIRVAKISALYELGRIDEVKSMIAEENEHAIPGPHTIELDRIKRLVDQMTDGVTKLAGEKTPTLPTSGLAQDNARQRRVMDEITKILAGSGDEMNEWKAMQFIRDATSIFTDPVKGKDSEQLEGSLAKLAVARKWAQENRSTTNENDALWGTYLCYSRLGQPSEAAEALQSLRENIEEARANIKKPLERGGVSSKYPWLFEALCLMLTESRQPLALLDAMEGAKGRAVADLAAERMGKPIDERELARPALRLPELMKRVGSHYLSFLVDDDSTYAVLVGKDGSVHAADAIPLGKKDIRGAAPFVDPTTWGVNPVDYIAEPVTPPSQSLSALVEWLEPLFDSGVLSEGDHICYSPDEQLHHIPLHYLEFRGKPLVGTFSVSRTHGAYSISLLMDRPAPPVPKQATTIEVPTITDAAKPKFMQKLHRVPAWLSDHLGGDVLEGEEATVEKLSSAELSHRIVHFATHGLFPREGSPRARNPYRSSGLLLSDKAGLPNVDVVAKGGQKENILTPKEIMDLKLNLTGSCVVLEACVSGLAEEGIGGDALGMDWALTQAGANSLLVSHWDVSVSSSAEFLMRFYRYWLTEGISKAEAWRQTILELWEAGGELADPYAWAAFSLCGDWR